MGSCPKSKLSVCLWVIDSFHSESRPHLISASSERDRVGRHMTTVVQPTETSDENDPTRALVARCTRTATPTMQQNARDTLLPLCRRRAGGRPAGEDPLTWW